MKNTGTLLCLSVLFCFLLAFPEESFHASKQGLILWFDTLLPTLLPFLIISQLILKTSAMQLIEKILGPVFQKVFHCSKNGAFCFLCGFLCGYPVGARLISLQLKEKELDLCEGQYLLSFCNNVSPVFCVSYGIIYALGTPHIFPYLLIIYGSAMFFGFLTRPKNIGTYKDSTKKQTPTTENLFQLIDVCIIDSFLIMIKLCGYLMLFSIMTKAILCLIPKSEESAVLISCFLEITGGLSLLTAYPQTTFRTLTAIVTLSFGGLCCIFQTNSVISDTDLSLKKYIIHKGLITILAIIFFFLWQLFRTIINGRC